MPKLKLYRILQTSKIMCRDSKPYSGITKKIWKCICNANNSTRPNAEITKLVWKGICNANNSTHPNAGITKFVCWGICNANNLPIPPPQYCILVFSSLKAALFEKKRKFCELNKKHSTKGFEKQQFLYKTIF